MFYYNYRILLQKDPNFKILSYLFGNQEPLCSLGQEKKKSNHVEIDQIIYCELSS